MKIVLMLYILSVLALHAKNFVLFVIKNRCKASVLDGVVMIFSVIALYLVSIR